MADGDQRFDPVSFTPEEFEEYFGDPKVPADDERPRRRRRWARVVATIAATAMLAGTATLLVDAIRNFASIREPIEIRSHALERIAESPWGWLATDVVIVDIPEPDVGARVTNNPPDGIITIDRRNWSSGRLDRLIDHELGHLIDFAIWGSGAPDRRGGLGSEPWAECAAVEAGTRSIDRGDADERYHCFADELDTYRQTLASLDEVCRRWGEPECRSVATLRP